MLKTAILEQGIALESVDDLGGALGTSSGGCIRVLNGLSPAMEFTTLVHEYAHLCARRGYVASEGVTMFDRIYQWQSVLARHRDGPWADERTRFLQHVANEGRAPNTLMNIAATLRAMACQFDGWITGNATAADIALGVDAWLDSSVAHFGAPHRRSIARTAAIFHTTAWLRYLHRYAEPDAPVIPGADLLADLLVTLREERGFAAATLGNHLRTIRPFLAWLADQHRSLADTTLSDVSSYLATKSERWSRATIACHVQSLRTFFRYAARRRWCAAGIGDTIDAPRLYTHERLPQGPRRSEVRQLVDATRGDTPTAIRNHAAILLLHTVYGFRSGEVRGLTLDDLDWEGEIIRPPRPKQRRVGEYPCSMSESFPGHLPGFPALLYAAQSVVGFHAWLAPTVGALVSSTAALAVWWAAWSIYQSRLAAAAASLLFAVTPVFALYGGSALSESVSSFPIAVAVGATAAARRSSSVKAWWSWHALVLGAVALAVTVRRENAILIGILPAFLLAWPAIPLRRLTRISLPVYRGTH